MTTKPPIPVSALPEGWIDACREAKNQHEGVPLRANPSRPEIEAWSINRRMWMPLTLPGGGTTFETLADRDAVLRQLEGA